ncbi:MAG: hypothetical protein ACK515_03190 [bacterium]|nr:hypothetical protein [Betaproteobacteria bacterium]
MMRARLKAAAREIIAAFELSGMPPGNRITPAMLVDALDVFFDDCERIDSDYGPTAEVLAEDVNGIADQIFECLHDLGNWAEKFKLRQARISVIDISLEVAQWCMRHRGQLRQIGPVVAALANRANMAGSLDACIALSDAYEAVIANVAIRLQADHTSTDPLRPWRQLLINAAIVSTRSRDLRKMERAYRRLETHLPSECPAFFQQAAHQVAGLGFSPEARALVQSRNAKWTSRGRA